MCRRWCRQNQRAPRAPQPCSKPKPVARRWPAECRSWCCQSRRAPRAPQPSNRPIPTRTVGRRPAECRRMVSSKPASPPCASALQLTKAGCWTAARRVQKMVLSKPVSALLPRPAAGRRPIEWRRWCRRSQRARRVPQPSNRPKSAAGRRPAECQQSAGDGVVKAGESSARSSPATD